MPAPGRRCPACLEGGQTVWVVFGKCCPNCGTPTAPKPPDEPKSTYNGKSRDDLVEVDDAAEKRRTQNKIAQRRFRGMQKGRIYQCLYPPCTYTSRQESNLKQHIEKSHSQINFRSKDNSENDGHVSQRAYAIDATHLEEEVGGEDTVRSAGPVTATTEYSSTGFPSTNDTPTNFQSASTTMEDLEPESTITSASWTDDLPEPVAIKCVCDFRDDTRHIVQCEQCETWQHISCYYENAKRIVSIHKCVKCSPRDLAKQYEEPSGFGEQETSSATSSLFTSGKYKSPTATESKTTSVSTADYTTGASDIESGSVADRKAAGLLPVTPERDRELRTALLHTGDNLTIGSDRTELDKLEAVLSTSLTEAPESTIDVDTSTEETGMEKNHSDEPDTAEYPANTPSNSEKPSDLALKATEKSRQIDKATVSTVSSNYGGSGPHDLRVHSEQNRILEGRVGMSTMNYAISDDQRFFFGPGFQYEDDLPSAGSISDASTTYQSSGLGSDSTNYTVYSIGGSSSPTFSIRPVMRRHESDFSPIRLTRESTPPSVATPARSTQDLRDAFKRAHTKFRNHSLLSRTSITSTDQARPRPTLRRNEPLLSKQIYKVMRQRAPRGSDTSNPHADQPITTRTNSGDTSEIRLRVDTSAPLILATKGEMEGRTLQVNPIEDGRAEIVIGSQPNRQTPTRDSRSNAEIDREPKHEKEHHFPSLRYELGRHTLDTGPSITAKFNESLVFNLLRNIESLDDLYACAMVNRVFYHVFKQHEPGLLEAVKKEPTRPGATSTSADLELHDAEDRGDLLSNDFPASTDVMNPLFKKVRVAKAETSGQRDRRRRVPLEELDQTYTPLGQGMSQWKWNLGFEAEVITQSGDNPFIEEFHEFRKLRAEHLRLKEQSSAEGPTSTRSGARISQLRRLEKFCEARNMKGPVLQSFEALFSQEFNGEEEITQQSHAELQPRPSEEEQERKTGKKLILARAHILSLAEITRQAPEGILYTLSRYGGYGDLTKNQRPQPPVAPGPDFRFVVTKHPDDFRTNSKIAMPKKRTKTGCLTCRKRRIKCGEERPTCMNCIKSKRQCEGYNQRVVFSTHVGMWLGRTGLRTKAKLQYPISTSYSSDQLLLQDHQGNLAPTRFIPLSYIWPLQDLWMSLPLWLRESFRSSDNDWAQDWSIQLLLQDNESTLAPIQLRGWNWRERPAVRVLLLEYENTLTPIHSLGRTYSDLVHEQWLEVRSLYSSDNQRCQRTVANLRPVAATCSRIGHSIHIGPCTAPRCSIWPMQLRAVDSLRLPGFEVSVEVDGSPLPEYLVQVAADDDNNVEATPPAPPPPAANTVTKYIEVPLSGEFTIRHTCKPEFSHSSDQIHADISLDGKTIFIPHIRHSMSGQYDSQVCLGAETYHGETMTLFVQKFRFAELVVEEEQGAITDEVRRQMQGYGEIRLDFFFTEKAKPVVMAGLPQMEFEDIGPLSEKAVQKATAITGDALTQSAGLSAAEEKVGGRVDEIRIVGNLGTFIYKYRITEALKSLGIIPRTPVPTPPRDPTPLCDRDITTLNLEESHQLLEQLRSNQRDGVRVKREREESNDTAVGDDDDDVQWMMSRPTETARKRLRRLPTVNDEIVELDD